MKKFVLVGLSDNPAPQFSEEVQEAIGAHRVFAGGVRHKLIVDACLPGGYEWVNIKAPLSETLSALERAAESVLVFTSGDPLFYGFGATLQRAFPDAAFQYFPTFNSLQLLAQRLGKPYQQMANTSVTGRSWAELDAALIRGEALIGVLTDKRKTPARIAERLLDYRFTEYEMTVGEALGGADERIRTFALKDVLRENFNELNSVILQKTDDAPSYFGIPEDAFRGLPGRPNMITKMPFRLATLSQLELKSARTFWDIGFCTGSIAIEARLLFPHLQITAFEKRPECEEIFEENSRRFRAPGVQLVMQDFFDVEIKSLFAQSTKLDAAFIGGHGGRIEEMLSRLNPLLASGGRVAINAVKQASADDFKAAVRNMGFLLNEPILLTLGNHNPITILSARKP
ncbi:precorrin-6y C5,15-methyltransferase (decarboxylating), CbiE subunit [Chloroherpeton thalassium ATCC 35110]|uniref:Precorrin-6y C5,15-methyltransferase (Decarboxylating), CbiE subunit n=1 Tax=Chloroherpeton thalassium (strain ATCC 35110 / GB-78) TaxID=517418 RepID=B3QW14_CHLT3|nr:bifunctional cobalt-precorrin-7 (C(5))-methyltransferase/cobalt-precorrin-6B (C(15))-methyltransferase [Chloroherpeton thalassium]ACF14668.1 precorrin-6y C5,15-methyltransferase (decarboxylating), CbiE subunit [Chloroherpeton thalassium ATCC 35110]